jgi:hypothetical protein
VATIVTLHPFAPFRPVSCRLADHTRTGFHDSGPPILPVMRYSEASSRVRCCGQRPVRSQSPEACASTRRLRFWRIS